ncbi:MAG: hypothetical protein DRP09_16920 [Candidatus Thorarchaeota archaeon]|nr:MAG: hypothetical protein DRP09_16920 [Candidatus Thorarchaeota archaeon]
MAIIPQSKPKDIKPGDKITAKWLNKSKNTIANLSASAPLQISQANGNFNITHAPHGPVVRWGRVCSDYVWSDSGTVAVYPLEYSRGSDFEYETLVSSEASSIVNLFITNPPNLDPILISDITKGIVVAAGDKLAYLPFGDKYGVALSAVSRTNYYQYDITQHGVVTNPQPSGGAGGGKTTWVTVKGCNADGVLDDPETSYNILLGDHGQPVRTSLQVDDIIRYVPFNTKHGSYFINGTIVGQAPDFPNHSLLGTGAHSDVAGKSPSRGSVIYGHYYGSYSDRLFSDNDVVLWDSLVAPSDASVLVNSSSDTSWKTPNQSGNYTLNSVDGVISWEISSDAGATHALLQSDVHLDTVTSPPEKGAFVVGNATPKWEKLVAPDNASVLVNSTTTTEWKTPTQTGEYNLTSVEGVVAWEAKP